MVAMRGLVAITAITASLAAGPGLCATAFDNFGPGFTYDPDLSFVVGVDGFGVNSVGAQFTAQATGFFSMLWIAASAESTEINDGLVYSIRSDSNGAPDELLESVVFDEICFETDCPDGEVYSRAAPGGALLTAGQQYWLVASVSDSDSGFSWFAALEGQGPGTIWIQNALFPDGAVFGIAQPPVFRIDVMAEPGQIPEPPAALLFTAVAAGLFLSVRELTRLTRR